MITPGLVELGSQSDEIHRRLGQLAGGVFESVYLAGFSERTENLEVGLARSTSVKVHHLANSKELWPTVERLAESYDWILLENDLPDQY